MNQQKTETPTRGEMLKRLREAHAPSVERTQALVKEQRQLHQAICQFIQETPKTVPQIASQIGKTTSEVLWYLAVMKKYGVVIEAGMCGDYPLYHRVKESAE